MTDDADRLAEAQRRVRQARLYRLGVPRAERNLVLVTAEVLRGEIERREEEEERQQ